MLDVVKAFRKEKTNQVEKRLFDPDGGGHRVYCAFCKSPRKLYNKKSISIVDFVLLAGLWAVLMYLFFQGIEPKFILVFVSFLAIAEMVIQVRRRISLVCRRCGFDPILYLKSPEKAADKVTKFLDLRKNRPEYALLQPLDLPKRKVIKEQSANEVSGETEGKIPIPNKKGNLLSKQI